METFTYYGSAKIYDIIDSYADRLVEAGDRARFISCKLIPTSLTTTEELQAARKQLVAGSVLSHFGPYSR